jgi:hypothetical protein
MKHKALEMIAEGYPVEIVMDILGLEPDELLDIINEEIGDVPGKVHVVECVLQVMESEILGEFDVNVN